MTNSDTSLPPSTPTSTALSASIVGGSAMDSVSRNEVPTSPVDVDLTAPPLKHGTLEEWVSQNPADARRLGFLPTAATASHSKRDIPEMIAEPACVVSLDLDAPLPTHMLLSDWIRMYPDEARRIGLLTKD